MKSNKVNSQDFEELIQIFCQTSDPRSMQQLFEELFTPSESKDITLRWKLMKLLKSGHTQRDIASELGISLCKITRGAKVLKKRGSYVNQALEQKIIKDSPQ